MKHTLLGYLDKWCSANVASSETRMVEPFLRIY
nr:MAG TPA: hypothetical protein [Caudoviricetes sp.]